MHPRDPCRLARAGLSPTSGLAGSYLLYPPPPSPPSPPPPAEQQLRPRAVANPSRSLLACDVLKWAMSASVKMHLTGAEAAAAAPSAGCCGCGCGCGCCGSMAARGSDIGYWQIYVMGVLFAVVVGSSWGGGGGAPMGCDRGGGAAGLPSSERRIICRYACSKNTVAYYA